MRETTLGKVGPVERRAACCRAQRELSSRLVHSLCHSHKNWTKWRGPDSYIYAECNPTNATDPTGKFCWQTAAAPLLLVAGIGLMLGATFVAPEAVAFALVVGETTFAITGATMSAVGALGLFAGLGVEAWGVLTCGG